MKEKTVFDTDSVAREDRLEYWVESACKSFTNLQVTKAESSDGDFRGKLTQKTFGKVSISSALAQDSHVQLTREGIANANEELLLLHLQHQGQSNILHDGREMALHNGDIEIVDCTKPYKLQIHSAEKPLHEMLVLKIPLALMYPRVVNIGELSGGYIPGKSDMGCLVSHFIINAWDHWDGVDHEVAAVLGEQILDLVSLAFNKGAMCESEEAAIQTGHMVRMKRFINANLTNRSLSPATVSKSACISLRYAHQLFAQENLSISNYIIERRLAECEKMLCSSKYRHLTITEIAHMWGFKDSSHFGHAFKKKFDMSPNAYRQCVK